ncbi:WecB/TagA/CpsF family glycosyltransferase [Aquibium sp. LZ166]|uniref:WecB/TagA/CpsF family glycosyltransferase n=1 Tax=Aquibium pacificus TaxID=3153579 RepID=A0ABV3SCU5_9HYPH
MNIQSVRHLSSPVAETRPTRNILGVDVAPLSWSEAIDVLERRMRERRFTKVGFLNAHAANSASADPAYAAAMQDFMVLPDGVGVDMASRMLYGANFPANLNGTDLVPAFLKALATPVRVGLLGTSRRNVEVAAENLRAMLPQHEIIVVSDGFFSDREESGILERLRQLRPDVLLVAMGVPRQELWMDRNLTDQHCTLAFAVGALLDFMSGAVPRAPTWIRRSRLEWLFRLILEPSRLWRRYMIGNPVFLIRIVRQLLLGR